MRRASLVVEIDLDPVPGYGANASSHAVRVEELLQMVLGHYHPTVRVGDLYETCVRECGHVFAPGDVQIVSSLGGRVCATCAGLDEIQDDPHADEIRDALLGHP